MSKPLIKDAATLGLPTVAILVVLSVLWGATFLFITLAISGFPPLTMVLLRVGIAAVALLPVLWLTGQSLPRHIVDWQPFVMVALLNNVVPFSLFAWSQYHIASSLAGVLNATTPIFNLILAWLWFQQPILGNKLAGLLIGLVGVTVLVGPDLTGKSGGTQALGILACLLGCLCYSVSGQSMRRFSGENPLKLATMLMITSAIILLPLSMVVDRPWLLPPPSTTAILGLLALALLSTAVAYILFFRVVVTAGPSNAQLVTLLIPVSAMIVGASALGETISFRQVAGAIIIVLGLVAIDGRALTALRRRGSAQ